VADQNGVIRVLGELAPGLVGNRHAWQRPAGFALKRSDFEVTALVGVRGQPFVFLEKRWIDPHSAILACRPDKPPRERGKDIVSTAPKNRF
jgi:hypothetical protein